MTEAEKLYIYGWGGIIWDRGGNFSKFVNQGSHQGALHWGTWVGCLEMQRSLIQAKTYDSSAYVIGTLGFDDCYSI